MTYNPYSAVNSIYNLKGMWDDANNSGDAEKAKKAATDAQKYYQELRDNGYGDVADQLASSNYANAKSINDKWAKTGRTATRDYFYSLGKSKGMSESDIDALIGWDGLTGEVSFGGKKIGKPDALVDGVSYWSDTSILDQAFNDYISRSGTTTSTDMLINQHDTGVQSKINSLWGLENKDHEDLTNMWKGEYDKINNTNPFTTEEAKAILAKYDLAGLQGRDNAVASGSATNGGNIDSYAAANAMRQQASLINQGQMAVLDAHDRKLANARAILEGLGVYQKDSYAGMSDTIGLEQSEAQRLFENKENSTQAAFDREQTAKLNDTAIKSEMASVLGINPDEWVASNNPYLNDDGTIKEQYKDVDFSAVMEQAKANKNDSLYKAAAMARFYKIMGDYAKYGQWDDGNYLVPEEKITESARVANMEDKTANNAINADVKIADSTNATNKYITDSTNATNLTISNNANATALEQSKITAQNNLAMLDRELEIALATGNKSNIDITKVEDALARGEMSQTLIDAYNAYYGTSYTIINPPVLPDDSNGMNLLGESGSKTTLTDSQVKEWADTINKDLASKYGSQYSKSINLSTTGNYSVKSDVQEYITKSILESSSLTDKQKQYLIVDKFGISPNVINTIANDKHYR